ncbi:hypothetical protein CPT_Summit_038 [Stenotrophomonas phage Summit]|nr:hypothetical protein CPT_Summit_038 [Stenotrophomonas phage Summit]
MKTLTKRCPNAARRRCNRAIYRSGELHRLKAKTGMWRIQSGMNNVAKKAVA